MNKNPKTNVVPALDELAAQLPEGAAVATELIASTKPVVLTRSIGRATSDFEASGIDKVTLNEYVEAKDALAGALAAANHASEKANPIAMEAALNDIHAARSNLTNTKHLISPEDTRIADRWMIADDIRRERSRLGGFGRVKVRALGGLAAGMLVASIGGLFAFAEYDAAAQQPHTTVGDSRAEYDKSQGNIDIVLGGITGIFAGLFAVKKIAGSKLEQRAEATAAHREAKKILK